MFVRCLDPAIERVVCVLQSNDYSGCKDCKEDTIQYHLRVRYSTKFFIDISSKNPSSVEKIFDEYLFILEYPHFIISRHA